MDEHADAPGGESLGHLIKKGRLDRGRVVTVLQQVADALDHAHANGKKPSNILLDDKKRAYVADFGLAHLAEASVVLTRTGMMAGTPHYMAPEQVMAKRVDLRADIYALGIVTYEMLTGDVPFKADTPVGLLLKPVNEPLPIPPRDHVPEALMRPLLKALAKNPANRWSSAGALATALSHGLDEVVSNSTVLISPPVLTRAPVSKERRCCMNLRVATTVPSQRRHDPIANDAGRPSSVMRFRML